MSCGSSALSANMTSLGPSKTNYNIQMKTLAFGDKCLHRQQMNIEYWLPCPIVNITIMRHLIVPTLPPPPPPAPSSFVISWGLGEHDICGKNSSHLSLNLIQIRSDRPQVQSLIRNISSVIFWVPLIWCPQFKNHWYKAFLRMQKYWHVRDSPWYMPIRVTLADRFLTTC